MIDVKALDEGSHDGPSLVFNMRLLARDRRRGSLASEGSLGLMER
jgi:hypothetical protein